MPTQHATSSTHRRGSSSAKSGMGNAGGGGGGVTSTSGHANRARMDANLRMSSKANEEATTDKSHHAVTSHVRNKSSDRLHRLAAGHSSGNLASHGAKRSKSYSQIMSATGERSSTTSSNSRKNKLRRGRSEGHANVGEEEPEEETEVEEVEGDGDGWTTADQTSSDSNPLHSSQDTSDHEEEEDDVVTFGKKKAYNQPNGSLRNPAESHDEDHHAANQRRSSDDTLAASQLEEKPTADSEPVAPPLTSVKRNVEASRTASNADQVAAMPRLPSSSSVRTLTGSGTLARNEVRDLPPSPSTTASFNHRTSLIPRASHLHAVPPKLSTEYAFAGAGNDSDRKARSLHRSSDSDVGAAMVAAASDSSRFAGDRSTDSAPHYRFSTVEPSGGSSSDFQPRRRKTSVSSARSSIINLPGVSPSLGTISHDIVNAESTGAQTSRAIEAMQRATLAGMRASQSSSTLPRERTQSMQSNGSIEAARLANKLRMTRSDSINGSATNSPAQQTTSASRLLVNSGSKYFLGGGSRADASTAQAMAKYNKPTISVFVKRQDDFKSIEKLVEPGNLFDERFARASLGEGGADEREVSDGQENTNATGRARYLMDYGLSGPALDRNATTQALLSTCLDNDEFEATWAPALTQAAGLGGAQERLASGESSTAAYADIATGGGGGGGGDGGVAAGLGGGVFINGPNATPLHFLHGLTNTNDSPFPLDEADVGPIGVANGMMDAGSRGEYIDAKNLRAVALTWAALNTTKNHIVTRRYVDPMRESLERVTEAARGGQARRYEVGSAAVSHDSLFGNHQASKTGHHGGAAQHASSPYSIGDHRSGSAHTPGSGSSTPGGTLRWGWRSLFADQTPHE